MSAASEILGIGIARKLSAYALDFLFPPLCISCRARIGEAHALCAACWAKISFIDGAVCESCGIPFGVDPGGETVCGACHANPRAFRKARSLLIYDEASKELILGFKHGDRLDRAPAFARWLDRTGRELLEETDLLVPVPLHQFRLWKRRYNQAAILASRLSERSGVPCDPLALIRSRPTKSQGDMPSAKARRRNVLGAFSVPEEKKAALHGKRVLLIDDVFTTGATLEACARAFKRAGAARVDALTLARVVKTASSDI
jgi:ComF family protein